MHGTLRFLLAILVALSHLGVSLPNFNQGVFAVVIFYLLAGMVSYKLIATIFLGNAIAYYINRIQRIFPLYSLALCMSFIVYGLGVHSPFLSSIPTLNDYIANLTIIPLSYYMYTGQDSFVLIPPAWSLGVELQYYITAPFLLLYPKRFFTVLIFSFGIYVAATIGIIDTDIYGYRLLLGVICIFLMGALIQKAHYNDKSAQKILLTLYGIIGITFAYVLCMRFKAPYNHETLLGLLIGIPLLYFTKSWMPKTLEHHLGKLSYAIFLFHFPMEWLLTIFSPQHSFISTFVVTLLFSIFLNYISSKRA